MKAVLLFWLIGSHLAMANDTLPFAILSGTQKSEETPMQLEGGIPTQVQTQPLRQFLEAVATSDFVDKVPDSQDWITFQQLNQRGIICQFDEHELALKIDIPQEFRKIDTIHVSQSGHSAQANLAPSGKTSAFLNPLLSASWSPRREIKPDLQMYTGAYWKNWAMAAQLGTQTQWRPSRFSFIRDFESKSLRLEWGDFPIPATTSGSASLLTHFQPFTRIRGVALSKEFSLQPDQIYTSSGRTYLYLDRPARASVWVDGQPIARMNLDAGPHVFEDFPTLDGFHDAWIELIDPAGNTRIIPASYLSSQRLLKPGESQYVLSVGKEMPDQQPLALAVYRKGITLFITQEVGAKAKPLEYLTWAESSLGSQLGTFALRFEQSVILHETFDRAGRVGWIDPSRRFQLNFLRSTESPRPILEASFQIPIGSRTATQLYFNGEVPHFENPTISAGINQTFSAGFSAWMSLNHTSIESAINLSLGYSPPTAREHQVRTEWSQRDRSQKALWNYHPKSRWGNNDYFASVIKKTDENSFDLSAEQTWNRARFAVRDQANSPTQHHLDTRLSTALGFVDGTWGWGQPVQNSFVLIQRTNSRESLQVNPRSDGTLDGEVDGWGPLVLSGAPPYRDSDIQIQSEGAVHEMMRVKPRYLQGTLIKISAEQGRLLKGKLINAKGLPIALISGEMKSIDNPQLNSPFFTNALGEFILPFLGTGTFSLEFEYRSVGSQNVQMKVPESEESELDLGVLQIQSE